MDRRLKTFLEVARRGSLTAAAQHLNMTQSSLTKRLQLLEEDFGHKLFERGVHGATLTAPGEVLWRHAERIETELLQSREAMAAAGGAGLALLRIGAGPLFHLRYLADALLTLRRAHPETSVELVTGLYRETMPRLSERTLDIVFGADEGVPFSDELVFEPLTTVAQGVALRRDHPSLSRAPLTAGALQELDWVIYGDRPEDSALVNAFFAREGRAAPSVSLLTRSFTLGLQTVARSDCAMMVPLTLASKLTVENVVIAQTRPAIANLPAGAFLRRSSRGFAPVKLLVEAVRAGIC
ncbi:LysR family transcriptional regulator [Oceaniglobus trochenteri]|uniref:LysR family transcriptional regulator n=1 Tax=Oceaniglobus trochenteri TaxID=2763260 RepID=UPI001CFFD440|nr:LysR family transcriptional regulator [Oceaniglobus trochenteri]